MLLQISGVYLREGIPDCVSRKYFIQILRFEKKGTMVKKIVYENARFRQIAREIEDEIRFGRFRDGDCFYSRKELVRKYHVANLTAFHIMKLLEERGFIICRRGRRSEILPEWSRRAVLPPVHNRIAIITDDTPDGVPDPALEWLKSYLFNRMRNDGQEIIWGKAGEELPECDGVLALLEREKYPEFYESMKESGKAFCMLSCSFPGNHLALLLQQSASAGMMHFFIRHKIRTIFILKGSGNFLERSLDFHDYLPVLKIIWITVSSLRNAESAAKLRELILRNTENSGSAFFTANRQICQYLAECADSLPRTHLRNFRIIGTAGIILENGEFVSGYEDSPYPLVDLQIPLFARELLAMLYRQLQDPQKDAGFLHQFMFREPPFLN